MTELAISVQNLSKRYRIGVREERHGTLFAAATDLLTRPLKNLKRLRGLTRFGADDNGSESTIWALKDITFDVAQGEVVGVIGANGAGKTTLLKILSRITVPTGGRAELHGRVSSLLEVGTGFHDELTGRENVYLNASILGMTKREIDRKFDAIVDFSGVEKFIDTPTKRYSSGMRVRLAFAVSAFLEPEILLVDEVLSVGDAEFQKRCLGKMEEASAGGRTVLLVSHQMATISALCQRVLLFDGGRLQLDGPTDQVIARYLDSGATAEDLRWTAIARDRHKYRTLRAIWFTRWSLVDPFLGHGARTRCLETCELWIDYEVDAEAAPALIDIRVVFRDLLGAPLATAATTYQNRAFESIPRTGTFVLELDHIPFLPGIYRFDVVSEIKGLPAASVRDAGRFEVVPGDPYGTGRLPHRNKEGILALKDFSWRVEQPAAVRQTATRAGPRDGASPTK